MRIFSQAVQDIVDISWKALEEEDLELAREVEPLEEAIDSLNAEIKKRHIKRLRKGKCTIEMGFILSDITTNYERVADHCSNLAVSLIEAAEEEFAAHGYLDLLKGEDHPEFGEDVKRMKEKYMLP